jgi:hypothetical protein
MAVERHTRFPQSKQATEVDEPFTRRVASWTNRFQIAHCAKSVVQKIELLEREREREGALNSLYLGLDTQHSTVPYYYI